MELHELVERVHDQQSFFVFIEALIHDWNQRPDEWENGSIETFLDAALAWSKVKLDATASWRVFAEFLYAGKYYE